MNSNQFINRLQGKKIFILSPHFDDSILSVGMLIYRLKEKADLTIVNVFTKAHNGAYTLSAKQFLKTTGFSSALQLYKARKIEDANVSQFLNIPPLDLGETDALFRRKKKKTILGKYIAEIDHVYPTYRWHVIGKVSSADPAILKVKHKLQAIISKNALVITPFGVGNHVDHLILRRICEEQFPRCLFYLDFPYTLRLNFSLKSTKDYQHISLPVNLKIKRQLIKQYTSQVQGLFPSGVMPKHNEHFYIKRSIQL